MKTTTTSSSSLLYAWRIFKAKTKSFKHNLTRGLYRPTKTNKPTITITRNNSHNTIPLLSSFIERKKQ